LIAAASPKRRCSLCPCSLNEEAQGCGPLTKLTAGESLAKRLMAAVFMPASSDEQALAFVRRVATYPPIVRVFVDQARIEMAREILEPAAISVGTAASYPVGNQCSEAQVSEVRCAITSGAEEIDVGLNYTALKSGSYATLEAEVRRLEPPRVLRRVDYLSPATATGLACS